ncbi:MAG: HD domain-containing protein, partial [Actinobacteria bacterium]|nr:HD domain-containing protein [Actinomycetota bacterium]
TMTGAPDLDPGRVRQPPGRAWCHAWTATVDQAVRQWAADLGVDRGLAVVALGSYARRQLCPKSDVDVLLLHDGWARRDLEDVVQRLCYPLWDAGLRVGHAVRTPRDTVRRAADRVDGATALVDRRLVVGDPGLLDDLSVRARRWLRRHAAAVLGALTDADDRRRARLGPHPGMLEPHLKDGAGGLRDVHSLRWAAACLLGDGGLDALVGARYLGAADRHELAEAAGVLLAARCALHLADRSQRGVQADRLRLDLHDDVAGRMGLDGDGLLRRVGLAARAVAHVHGRTWPALLADARGGRRRRKPPARVIADGVRLVDGLVAVDADRRLEEDPVLGLRAVAAAAGHGTHLHRSTTERLGRQLDGRGALGWDGEARAALLSTLRAGRRGLPALADAGHVGLLAAHLPEWPRVRGHRQRNPLHRFDLDTHLLETVAELGDLAAGTDGARHAALWEGLADPDALVLAAALHDVGKAWPGDHSQAGARVARRWVARMGFCRGRAARVARYVELHLLLPDAATRRDLDDAAELAEVAARVGDHETLDGLYLLSLADARATGPGAHSAWKDGLLATLHTRLGCLLAGGEMVPAGRADELLAAASRQVGRESLDEVMRGVPDRYLVAADAGQLAEHARMLSSGPGPGQARASVRPGRVDGTAVVSVVAPDRRGLIADCAAVLAAHGLDVLEARAHTRADRLALDWFVVAAPRGGEPDAWLDDLRAVAAGGLDVADLPARGARRRARRADPVVRVRVQPRPRGARVEVRAADSPGLLHRLARALADAGLDV